MKLIYFNLRGRGEAIRYLLIDNDIDFEQEYVSFDDWPERKSNTPFGGLPIFVFDDGLELAQSNAILRHLARTYGFYGENDNEAAQIDMLNDAQEDLRKAYLTMIYTNYEDGKAPFIKDLPNQLAPFERILSKNDNGKGFFVGSKISFVDYNILDNLDNLLILSPECLAEFPTLKSFYERTAARPRLSEYRDTEAYKTRGQNANGKK